MPAFPGYTHYVHAAAEDLGVDDDAVIRAAAAVPTVKLVSDLVVQALSHPTVDPDTVRRVTELVDGLEVATEAARTMALLLDAPASQF